MPVANLLNINNILGFAAFSGVGKTTLLKQLIPMLRERGLRLGLVKLTHHRFEIDKPGKDSYELRQAGAQQVMLTSSHRWALMTERETSNEPELNEALAQMDLDALDLVLVEGFRHVAFPKIELHRPSLKHPLLFPHDRSIIAVATDERLNQTAQLPILDLNNPEQIAEFTVAWMAARA